VRASRLERKYAVAGYTMLSPALIVIALVTLFPIGYSIWMSLNNITSTYNGFQFSWTGVSNYVTVFTNALFWQALSFTVIFAAITVTIELVLGLLIALALNQPIRARGIAIAVMLVPWTLITVISAQMWGYIYNGIYGVLNAILLDLHIIHQPILWLGSASLATFAMVVADVWKTTPFVCMIMLAGLQLIPNEMYEAAKIDGSSAWNTFWSVTFPLLRPSIGLAALFRILQAFGLFDLPFVLTEGGPGTSTMPIAYLAYKAIFNDGNFGTGTAVAVATVGIVIILALASLKALRTQVGEIE
jgi:multiple sugar transport system permease protein